MKQTDRFNESTTTRHNQDTISNTKWISNYRAALLGSSLMLVGLLGVYGCSKKSEQPTAVVAPNPSPIPSSPVSTLVASSATDQAAAPKRIVQRRSPTATYTNDAYGISFRYPLNYKLKKLDASAGDAKPAAMESPDGDPGEVALASVQVPQSLYPKTDFSDGYFSVSANRKLTEDACQKSVISHEDSEVFTEKVNGVEFHWTENSGADDQASSEWRSYAGFANGTCYEVQLGMETTLDAQASDKKPVKKVSHDRVFSRLEAILSSIKVRPVAVPAVEPPVRSAIETPSATPNAPAVEPAGSATVGQSTAPAVDASKQQ